MKSQKAKAKNKNNQVCEIVAILDRSGSMYDLVQDTIGGYNEFLKMNRELPGKANITTVLFDYEYSFLCENQDINSAPELNTDNFVPRGSTALYDAVGRGVSNLIARNPEHAIVCIVTDGGENASREFDLSKVKDLLETCKQKNWEVVFLAANQDAFATANTIGASGAMNFAANSKGVRDAYSSMYCSTAALRSSIATPDGESGEG